MSGNAAFDNWTRFYKEAAEKGVRHLWPAENLVRMMMGNYIPGLDKNYGGKRALDVGCGSGNNLVFLASLGMEVAGTEISEDVCGNTAEFMKSLGYDADVRVGTNTGLPFEDDSFDFLVSWNVLHYEPEEKSIKKAVLEHARVLKPGGLLILSTAAPDHLIMNDARVVGPHQYEIARKDDFRKGETFFYFDHPRYIEHYFSTGFGDMHIGRIHDNLFGRISDFFIVAARSK
ncbi:MAG: methyltransferase domain-containing protein [Verrucomicrobia bacterium]|nr:methyltransferase domain-containing protein [Verrucomicrobiota bacterium]